MRLATPLTSPSTAASAPVTTRGVKGPLPPIGGGEVPFTPIGMGGRGAFTPIGMGRGAFTPREALSSYGALCLVIVGGLALADTLIVSRGLRGFAADRFGWSLLPAGSRVRLLAAKSRG